MFHVLLLLGTILTTFFAFALFAGMVVGLVHSLFALVLLCWGEEVQATVERMRQPSRPPRRRSRAAPNPEYQLTVCYTIATTTRSSSNGTPRQQRQITKQFTTRNWHAFQDVQVGTEVTVRVWPSWPGWASLRADLVEWNQLKYLGVLGLVVAMVYTWCLYKVAFQVLPNYLASYGIDPAISTYYILGACLLILPTYFATTIYTLTKTEETSTQGEEVTLTTPRTISVGNAKSRFTRLTTANSLFSNVLRGLQAETYNHDLEMREMLPQRRAPHEFV